MNFSHLQDVEESYFGHMGASLKLFVVLGILSYVALIHAVLPFVMTDVVSKKIENIKNTILERG